MPDTGRDAIKVSILFNTILPRVLPGSNDLNKGRYDRNYPFIFQIVLLLFRRPRNGSIL